MQLLIEALLAVDALRHSAMTGTVQAIEDIDVESLLLRIVSHTKKTELIIKPILQDVVVKIESIVKEYFDTTKTYKVHISGLFPEEEKFARIEEWGVLKK